IARPSRDLRASERFWVDGLGLEVLFRADASAEGGHALLMVGWPDATWHLELVKDAPRPGNVTNYVNPRQVWWRSASIGVPPPTPPQGFRETGVQMAARSSADTPAHRAGQDPMGNPPLP